MNRAKRMTLILCVFSHSRSQHRHPYSLCCKCWKNKTTKEEEKESGGQGTSTQTKTKTKTRLRQRQRQRRRQRQIERTGVMDGRHCRSALSVPLSLSHSVTIFMCIALGPRDCWGEGSNSIRVGVQEQGRRGARTGRGVWQWRRISSSRASKMKNRKKKKHKKNNDNTNNGNEKKTQTKETGNAQKTDK